MKILELESLEDFDTLTKNNIIVDFYATWCQPCKMLAKIIEEHESDVECLKVDVDKFQSLAIKYNVRGVPTLAAFKEGHLSATKSGLMKDSELGLFIKSNS